MKFLPSSGCVSITAQIHHMDGNKMYREKSWWELNKNASSYIEQILEATLHEEIAVQPFTSYL